MNFMIEPAALGPCKPVGWDWKRFGVRRSVFAAFRLVCVEAFGPLEVVGRGSLRGMVMEAAPIAPLVMAPAEVQLAVMLVALDAPARVSGADQLVERRALGQHRQANPVAKVGRTPAGSVGLVARKRCLIENTHIDVHT